MHKLHKLRDYLLNSLHGVDPAQLLTFVEQGKVISTPGIDNNLFRLDYTATIILTDFQGHTSDVTLLLVQWLAHNQPDHNQDAMNFEADIHDSQTVDLAFKIALTEVSKQSKDIN